MESACGPQRMDRLRVAQGTWILAIPWILAIAGSPYHPEAGGTMENMQLLESRGQDSPMGIIPYGNYMHLDIVDARATEEIKLLEKPS